jgi:hypothetical protein
MPASRTDVLQQTEHRYIVRQHFRHENCYTVRQGEIAQMAHQTPTDSPTLIFILDHERHLRCGRAQATVARNADDAAARPSGRHDRRIIHAINLGKGVGQRDREFSFQAVEAMLDSRGRQSGMESSKPLPIVWADHPEMDVMNPSIS